MGNGEDVTDLRHKVALVTGASSGLGRDFCLALARHGCKVVAAARRTELLHALIQDIHNIRPDGSSSSDPDQRTVTAIAIQMDISAEDESQVDAAVERAWAAFGRIDVLINNAGIRGDVKAALDLESEEWNKVISTNLRGTWLISKTVGKRMHAANIGGSIINISSTASLERTLLPNNAAYAASKAAVNQLTKVMAIELGKHKIRVNAIAAGIFKSEITEDLFKKPWVHMAAQKTVPAQRWGLVDPDLTSLVALLASDLSHYITGTIFIVDGGQSIVGVPIQSSL